MVLYHDHPPCNFISGVKTFEDSEICYGSWKYHGNNMEVETIIEETLK